MPSPANPNDVVTGAGLLGGVLPSGPKGKSQGFPSGIITTPYLSPRDIFQTGIVDAGGAGDSTEIANNLTAALQAVDEVLKRRRAFTATIAATGSGIRSADLEADALDALWTVLNDQVTGQSGGVFFVHAREDSDTSSYTVTALNPPYYPYMIAEQRNSPSIPVGSAVETEGVPVEPTTASSNLTGLWDGFRFRRSSTNTFRLQSGFEARNCQFYDSCVSWTVNSNALPYTFRNCSFGRETATTGVIFTIQAVSNNALTATFENCRFRGGTGTTTTNLFITSLNAAADFTTQPQIVFRNCVFDGSGGLHTMELAFCDETIIFENCVFLGNTAATGAGQAVYVHDCEDVRFINCKFDQCPKPLYITNSGGVVENCHFTLGYPLAASTDRAIEISGSESRNPLVLRNNKVMVTGTFAEAVAASPDPAIYIQAINTVVDGLTVLYDSVVTNLHSNTLHVDFSGTKKVSEVRNITIDCNSKAPTEDPSFPSVIKTTNPTDGQEFAVLENISLVGVGAGNADGTGAQGAIAFLSSQIIFQNSTIKGPGIGGSDTVAHTWRWALSGGKGIINCDFPDLSTGEGFVFSDAFIRANASTSIRGNRFRQDNVSPATSIFTDGYIAVSSSNCEIVDNTFTMDPAFGYNIIHGIGASFGTKINDNDFLAVSITTTRDSYLVHIEGNYAVINDNYAEHRPDSLPGFRLEADFGTMVGNNIRRLEDPPLTPIPGLLIEDVGANNVVKNNKGRSPVVTSAVLSGGDLTITGEDLGGSDLLVEVLDTGGTASDNNTGSLTSSNITGDGGSVSDTTIVIDSTSFAFLSGGALTLQHYIRVNSNYDSSRALKVT